MRNLIIFSLIIFSLVFASGCKECQISSDCDSKARELYSGYSTSCLDVSCVDNKCEIDRITNCCGNRNCEENAGENKCACERDCGECEGKGEVKDGSRTEDAEYLEYDCDDNDECRLMIDDSLIKQISLTDEKELSYFTIEIKSSYDYPFNIDDSGFYVEIKLKDTDEDLVLPVSITNLKLVERELLIGEADVDETLSYVGDSSKMKVPVSYNMQEIEEEKRISLVIDYTYKRRERVGRNDEGEPIYENKVVRDSYEESYRSKIFFVDPD
jgi:hypothetical protein